jgi:uncharacterized membrane protein
MSFVYIGIYWGNHHHLLVAAKHVTASIIWANLNLLFWLSLIPFATGWMGENHFAQNAVVFYAILLLMCAFAFTFLQLCVEKQCKDNPKLVAAFANVRRKGYFSAVCYFLAIALAYYNTIISAILFCIVSIRWMIPDRNIEKAVTE